MKIKLSPVSRHLGADYYKRSEYDEALLNTRTRHYVLKEKITWEVSCKWENNIEIYCDEFAQSMKLWSQRNPLLGKHVPTIQERCFLWSVLCSLVRCAH
jgi:hypothetical protein